jgi:hypothetical protein
VRKVASLVPLLVLAAVAANVPRADDVQVVCAGVLLRHGVRPPRARPPGPYGRATPKPPDTRGGGPLYVRLSTNASTARLIAAERIDS